MRCMLSDFQQKKSRKLNIHTFSILSIQWGSNPKKCFSRTAFRGPTHKASISVPKSSENCLYVSCSVRAITKNIVLGLLQLKLIKLWSLSEGPASVFITGRHDLLLQVQLVRLQTLAVSIFVFISFKRGAHKEKYAP